MDKLCGIFADDFDNPQVGKMRHPVQRGHVSGGRW
jgi:hypothetical protein